VTAITPSTLNAESVAANTNAKSAYLRLNPGRNRISVYSTSWTGGKTAALKYAPIENDDSLTNVKYDATTAVSFTANDAVDVFGPGLVCIEVASANAAAVNILVAQSELM
jgi:hypothetical protein